MKTSKIGYFIFLLLASIFVFIVAHSISVVNNVKIEADDGVADLTGTSLYKNMAVISNVWLSYPDHLYTPEDFKGNDTEDPVVFDRGKDSLKYHYGTHRMILESENYYQLAVHFKSLDYSTKVYINGKEMDEIGKVGTTAGTSEAKTRECTYVFTPESGNSELILQYSNFVHKDGGNPPTIYVSDPNNIFTLSESQIFTNVIFVGCLLTAFLFYFCMFFIHTRRKIFLYFALCCFFFALRYIPVSLVFPDISWNICIRIEYLGVYAASMFLGIFIQSLFPETFSIYFKRFILIAYTAYLLIIALAPTTFFTGLVLYVQILSFAVILYVCIKLIKPARTSFKGALGLFAMIAILIAMLNDSLGLNSLPNLGRNDFMSLGIYIFVLSYMVILQLQASENERMLMKITQDNISLEKVNRLKTEFVSNVSHELKTPLTVMSNKAQVSLKQIKMGDADIITISDNLDKIVEETKILSSMIEDILNKSKTEENSGPVKKSIDINAVIEDVIEDFKTSINTNGSRFKLALIDGLPFINGDPVKIKQAMVNLISNAVKNTRQGDITITTLSDENEPDKVLIKIKDTGSGIEEQDMPYIFERFYKGENNGQEGTGLGLFITRGIIEEHGGTITIESKPGAGTKVIVSLPIFQIPE